MTASNVSQVWKKDDLTCKPLDSYIEVIRFVDNPPVWRTLCQELTPHSTKKLKNIDVNKRNTDIQLDSPETFCHYEEDTEDIPRYDQTTLPQTLVCHDLANGYHDDSYIEGTAQHDAYTFYNWAGVDIFCYFSHHLVTIPPLSWINVAHAHGVKVIGTLITEWDEGVAIWDRILKTEESHHQFADALISIAKELKFEGWLLNVENKIDDPSALLDFVRYLHRRLHQQIPHAVLLWYDSVTIQGHLNWQNALNEKNKAFFDACDGIFTNYSWTPEDVAASAQMGGAEGRLHDVFIGVDIWGRNFYGGGLFNTQEAVQVVHKHGCSMALFAPAWTHEAMSIDSYDKCMEIADMDKLSRFLVRDRALWASLWPYLNTRVPCQLPFRTSFCRGMGQQRRMYGEVLCNTPWYNLRHQQYQPNSSHGAHGYMLAPLLLLKEANTYRPDQKGILRYRESFKALHDRTTQFVESEVFSEQNYVLQDDQQNPPEKLSEIVDNHGSDENQEGQKHQEFQDEERQKEVQEQETMTETSKRENSIRTVLQNLLHLKRKRSYELIEGASKETRKLEESEKNEKLSVTMDEHSMKNAKRFVTMDENSRTVENNLNEIEENPNAMEESRSTLDTEGSAPDICEATERSMVRLSVSLGLGRDQNHHTYGLTCLPDERECLELWLEDSFYGGACLRVHPSDESCSIHRRTRILHCDFLCQKDMVVCVVTKKDPDHPSQSLNLKLSMTNIEGRPLTAVLIGRSLPQLGAQDPSAVSLQLAPLEPSSPAFCDARRRLLLSEPSYYVPFENAFGWKVRYYVLRLPGCRITAVNCRTMNESGPILLGHFAICALPQVIELMKQ